MRRSYDIGEASVVYLRPPMETCEHCDAGLWVTENQKRFVQRLDGVYCFIRQGLSCSVETCAGHKVVQRVPVDLRLALPRKTYGTEIVVEVGERHLQHGDSFGRIARDLQERGVPLSQRNTGRLFRSYVALTQAAFGDEEKICERLRAQGGVLLMADGVQYDNTSPVLYMAWDALSGTPLFGERKAFRGADDLVTVLERVKAMDVDVIAVVSDKEKGLVPAIARVFPDAPHQLCQRHFLGNCARGMTSALGALSKSVEARADRAQKIAKHLHVQGWDSVESDPSSRRKATLAEGDRQGTADGLTADAERSEVAQPQASGTAELAVAPIAEEQLVVEFCAMARHASRATGRAPLNPPEHVRHQRLESVRDAVRQALKKGATTPSLIA